VTGRVTVSAALADGPAFDAPAVGKADAAMVAQLGCRFRLSVTFEIGGRGDDDHTRRAELAGDQARAFQRAGTNGHIGAVIEEIDHAVGMGDVERDIRISREEGRHQRRQDVVAEGSAGVDADRAGDAFA
jgi:hypothetical protein